MSLEPQAIDEENDGSVNARWSLTPMDDRVNFFRSLQPDEAGDLFLGLPTHEQAMLIEQLHTTEKRIWLRSLAPDDAADVLQALPVELRPTLLDLFEGSTRFEVSGLLAYEEDEAGGLMSPRFARIRPDATIGEAISYLRRQARAKQIETLYYCYVLDRNQQLLGVISFRHLIMARENEFVRDNMQTEVISVNEKVDQEAVARLMQDADLVAVPVVDDDGRMKGIVTHDDIVDVVQEEATEDIQKMGGSEALDTPYMNTPLFSLIKKRAGWLAVLFVGEMFTTSAMSHFEHEIDAAVVLSVFIPLIISGGGNSGSQASTLVIRALALSEIRLRDWVKVLRRELMAGLSLGIILAILAMLRIELWQFLFGTYGEHHLKLAVTIALSVIGVVAAGAVAGSMLPFALRRAKLDPASASAPFVATLVDVTGLVVYFSIAKLILTGTILP